MSSITSYGTITIVDLTDVGQFSVYPYADGPNTQIYSEETQEYTPNWTQASPLTITPVITYAGVDKTTEAAVKWYIKGNDTPIKTIAAGVSDKSLKRETNLENITYVTYIVKATYTSETGADVEATGEISFNKLTQTATSKGVRISGNNVFKYIGGSTSPSDPTITLTPHAYGEVGYPANPWKYYNGTSFVNATGVTGLSIDSNTHALTIDAAHFTGFQNDIARFEVTVQGLYGAQSTYTDEFSVTKLRDGAAGGTLIQLDLSNDEQLVPFNSEGNPEWIRIGNLAGSQVTVYRGNNVITTSLGTGNSVKVSLVNVTAQAVKNFGKANQETVNINNGATLNLSGGYDAVLVTNFTKDENQKYYTSGKVQFILTYDGTEYKKDFSLTGIEAGEDGITPVVYNLEFSDAIKRINSAAAGATQDSWSYSPTNLQITAKSSDSTSNFAGDIWYKRKGDSSWTRALNGSTTTTGTVSINVANTFTIDKSPILFRLTTPGASNCDSYLDQEAILVTSDGSVGPKGQEGDDGVSALSVSLTNENESITTNSNYITKGQTITTKYQGYLGTNEVTMSFAGATLDGNVVSGLFGNISASQGVITIPVNADKDLSTYTNGSITLGFSYTDPTDHSVTTLNKKFTFNANPSGTDGADAINLQLVPNRSTFFKNQEGTVTVTPQLIKNGSNIFNTSTCGISWTNAATGASLGTGGTLSVTGTSVNGVLSVLCTVTYPKGSNKRYVSYISFTDYSDPLQVEVLCTLGDKIVNSIGEGVIYAQSTLNGSTLDEVKFGTEVVESTTGKTDEQLFLLTKSNNKVTGITLKTSTGTAGNYTNAELSPLIYNWSFRDIEGNALTLDALKAKGMYISPAKDGTADKGQFVYINANIINNKIICLVEVVKN